MLQTTRPQGTYFWEFEHQRRRRTVGLVPNFVCAVQQRGRASSGSAANKLKGINNGSSNNSKDGGSKGGPRRDGKASVPERAHLTSEASVSLAASQSDRSGHSADTYRTTASSPSTLLNFAMVQGCRGLRQRWYFLSLGTGTVFENRESVSGKIPALTTDDGASSASSDDSGSIFRHGFLSEGGGDKEGSGHQMSCSDGGVSVLSDNSSSSLSQRRLAGSVAHEAAPSGSAPSSTRPSSKTHVHKLFGALAPPQRRLSDGVSSQGVKERRSSVTADGGLLDCLYESISNCKTKEQGGIAAVHCGGPTTPIARQTEPAYVSPISKATRGSRPLPPVGLRGGLFGPSQALAAPEAKKKKTTCATCHAHVCQLEGWCTRYESLWLRPAYSSPLRWNGGIPLGLACRLIEAPLTRPIGEMNPRGAEVSFASHALHERAGKKKAQ
jgi:hypothetical protein